MTAFRAEPARSVRWRLAAALVVGMAAAGGGGVHAQGFGPPVSLSPAGNPGASQAEAVVPPLETPSEPLPSFALPDAAGVAAGGLGPRLWAGTPLALVQRLLAELPVAAPSPAQRRLTLRLLTSGAEPPSGDTGGYRLAVQRVSKLAALGAAAEVTALVAVIPGAFGDEAIARAWVEAQLVQTPDSLECSEVARLAQGFGGQVWSQLVAACQSTIHSHDSKGAPETPVAANPSVAELVLARAAGAAVPAAALSSVRDPLRLAAIARIDTSDADVRLAAAERAAAAGALTGTELAALYADVRFAPAELARPLSSTPKGGARSRALVYQALAGESAEAVRAELLRHAFALLEPAQTVGAVATVPLAALAELPVDAVTGWLAPLAVRAFTIQGRPETARLWRATAAGGLESRRLWPLAALAEERASAAERAPGGSDDTLAGWLRLMLTDVNAERRVRLGWILGVLRAAGESVSDQTLASLRDEGGADQAPPPAGTLWQTLRSATDGGLTESRLGEAVLAALGLLGEGGPQGVPPADLARIVAALRAAGLGADARALAREGVAALLAQW